MPWYNYIACFFAGAFLSNVVPHFVHGISGDPFPTPFAKPPGKGLSSPTVNVLWALLNLVSGYILFRAGHVSAQNLASLLVFFAGIAFLGIQCSIGFQKKHPRWPSGISTITHPADSPPPPCHTTAPNL